MRTTRNKAILKAVDSRIRVDSSKAELNLSRIITEFSRSRSNAELYEVVGEVIRWKAKKDEKFMESRGIAAMARFPNYYFDLVVHSIAYKPFHERRDSYHLRELKYRVTALEYRRINTVLDTYLHDNASEDNPFFAMTPVDGF